jgi:hypothetical protein
MTDKGTVRFRTFRCEWGAKDLFTLFRTQLQFQPNYTRVRVAKILTVQKYLNQILRREYSIWYISFTQTSNTNCNNTFNKLHKADPHREHTSKQTICVALNKKFPYHIFNCPSLLTILSPRNSVHTTHPQIYYFNPFKTKRGLFYLKTQFAPRSKHFSSRL